MNNIVIIKGLRMSSCVLLKGLDLQQQINHFQQYSKQDGRYSHKKLAQKPDQFLVGHWYDVSIRQIFSVHSLNL